MAKKKNLEYDQLLLDVAIGLDMEVDTVRVVVADFMGRWRGRLIDGKGLRVPNFGTIQPRYMAAWKYRPRGGGPLASWATRPATVGVAFIPSRRMVLRMREEFRGGKWV
jgi:hypothetical protein